MRKTLSASVLLLALCYPAFAGDMPTPPVPEPTKAVQEPTGDGIIHGNNTDSLTEIALDILAVLPSLL
jgi:hypothetical protein